jgi:hypothetical protein
MKEVKKVLLLAANTSDAKALEVLETLKREHTEMIVVVGDLEQAIKDHQGAFAELKAKYDQLGIDHKAQCDLGTEYSKFRSDLAEVLGSGTEAIIPVVKELKDDKEAFAHQVETLAETIKDLKSGTDKDTVIQIKAKLEKKAKDYLKANKDTSEVHITEDGEIYLSHQMAKAHSKKVGGLVHSFEK